MKVLCGMLDKVLDRRKMQGEGKVGLWLPLPFVDRKMGMAKSSKVFFRECIKLVMFFC